MPQRDTQMRVAHEDPRSVGELFSELTGGVQKLIRNEVALAKIELKDSVVEAKRGAILMAVALVPALIGLVCTAIGLTWLLAEVLPLWGAALIVAALAFGATGLLVRSGKKHLGKVDVTPDRTMEQLQETKRWLSHPISS